MPPSQVIFWLMLALLLGWAVVAWFSRRRHVKFNPAASNDKVFSCDSCGNVYTDDPDEERSLCPECGTVNRSVQF
jgi:predicted RNA-binding Zn-ribbon protein involved in translation (DUF1610 family)